MRRKEEKEKERKGKSGRKRKRRRGRSRNRKNRRRKKKEEYFYVDKDALSLVCNTGSIFYTLFLQRMNFASIWPILSNLPLEQF